MPRAAYDHLIGAGLDPAVRVRFRDAAQALHDLTLEMRLDPAAVRAVAKAINIRILVSDLMVGLDDDEDPAHGNIRIKLLAVLIILMNNLLTHETLKGG